MLRAILLSMFLVAVTSCFCYAGGDHAVVSIVSPDKRIAVYVIFRGINDPSGHSSKRLFYRVVYLHGGLETEILPYSTLGINRKDEQFDTGLILEGTGQGRPVNDRYTMLSGKRSLCENNGIERTLLFRNGNGKRLDIVFRVYNNGVCFRYIFPGRNDSAVTITGEATAFNIPHGDKRWMQEYRPEYEYFYTDSSLVKKSFWGFPALFEVRESPYWLLISEANITRANCASRLSNEADADVFKVALPASFNAFRDTTPSGKLPWSSAWRVMVIGKLADIFESTLITDVSDPSRLENTDWIAPGPAAWVYWANNHGSKDFRIVNQYTDLAVAMHWPYVLIDWEWDQMGDGGTVEDAIRYARSKGIKPLLWYNSGTAWLGATPVDRLLTREKRDKEFAWLEKMGVSGIKVDFFAGDQQAMMQYYIDILEDAARYHLEVNFHGATVPRGWSRTYPNLVSTEAVYGAEWYNNAGVLTGKASWHNTVLPFTRNVIGPMDYTPVTFTNSQHPHITSYAHELALSVVFESGIQHFADRPSGYYDLPAAPRAFLTAIPTAWDDSRLVDGYPGEKAIVARRKGTKWYIGGLNGTDQDKELTMNFRFIGKGEHILHLITDGKDSTSFSSKTIHVSSRSVVKVNCLARGGFAGTIQ